MGFAEACRMKPPAPGKWHIGWGLQVSECSSNCRVHSRGASSGILSNFQGPASNTVPPPTSLHAFKPQLSSHPLAVRKLELQSFVTRRSLPSRFRFEYCLRISLRFFRQRLFVDLRAHRISHNIDPPTLHLGADAVERSRNHLIHDEHNLSKSMQSSWILSWH